MGTHRELSLRRNEVQWGETLFFSFLFHSSHIPSLFFTSLSSHRLFTVSCVSDKFSPHSSSFLLSQLFIPLLSLLLPASVYYSFLPFTPAHSPYNIMEPNAESARLRLEQLSRALSHSADYVIAENPSCSGGLIISATKSRTGSGRSPLSLHPLHPTLTYEQADETERYRQ